MSWGSKTQFATNLSIDNTTDADSAFTDSGHQSSKVTLNPGEIADIQITVAFPAGATNSIACRVVLTLDDATETYDDLAFTQFTIGVVAGDTKEKSFVITGVYAFRLEFRKLGTATETHTVNCYYRKDGVNI